MYGLSIRLSGSFPEIEQQVTAALKEVRSRLERVGQALEEKQTE